MTNLVIFGIIVIIAVVILVIALVVVNNNNRTEDVSMPVYSPNEPVIPTPKLKPFKIPRQPIGSIKGQITPAGVNTVFPVGTNMFFTQFIELPRVRSTVRSTVRSDKSLNVGEYIILGDAATEWTADMFAAIDTTVLTNLRRAGYGGIVLHVNDLDPLLVKRLTDVLDRARNVTLNPGLTYNISSVTSNVPLDDPGLKVTMPRHFDPLTPDQYIDIDPDLLARVKESGARIIPTIPSPTNISQIDVSYGPDIGYMLYYREEIPPPLNKPVITTPLNIACRGQDTPLGNNPLLGTDTNAYANFVPTINITEALETAKPVPGMQSFLTLGARDNWTALDLMKVSTRELKNVKDSGFDGIVFILHARSIESADFNLLFEIMTNLLVVMVYTDDWVGELSTFLSLTTVDVVAPAMFIYSQSDIFVEPSVSRIAAINAAAQPIVPILPTNLDTNDVYTNTSGKSYWYEENNLTVLFGLNGSSLTPTKVNNINLSSMLMMGYSQTIDAAITYADAQTEITHPKSIMSLIAGQPTEQWDATSGADLIASFGSIESTEYEGVVVWMNIFNELVIRGLIDSTITKKKNVIFNADVKDKDLISSILALDTNKVLSLYCIYSSFEYDPSINQYPFFLFPGLSNRAVGSTTLNSIVGSNLNLKQLDAKSGDVNSVGVWYDTVVPTGKDNPTFVSFGQNTPLGTGTVTYSGDTSGTLIMCDEVSPDVLWTKTQGAITNMTISDKSIRIMIAGRSDGIWTTSELNALNTAFFAQFNTSDLFVQGFVLLFNEGSLNAVKQLFDRAAASSVSLIGLMFNRDNTNALTVLDQNSKSISVAYPKLFVETDPVQYEPISDGMATTLAGYPISVVGVLPDLSMTSIWEENFPTSSGQVGWTTSDTRRPWPLHPIVQMIGQSTPVGTGAETVDGANVSFKTISGLTLADVNSNMGSPDTTKYNSLLLNDFNSDSFVTNGFTGEYFSGLATAGWESVSLPVTSSATLSIILGDMLKNITAGGLNAQIRLIGTNYHDDLAQYFYAPYSVRQVFVDNVATTGTDSAKQYWQWMQNTDNIEKIIAWQTVALVEFIPIIPSVIYLDTMIIQYKNKATGYAIWYGDVAATTQTVLPEKMIGVTNGQETPLKNRTDLVITDQNVRFEIFDTYVEPDAPSVTNPNINFCVFKWTDYPTFTAAINTLLGMSINVQAKGWSGIIFQISNAPALTGDAFARNLDRLAARFQLDGLYIGVMPIQDGIIPIDTWHAIMNIIRLRIVAPILTRWIGSVLTVPYQEYYSSVEVVPRYNLLLAEYGKGYTIQENGVDQNMYLVGQVPYPETIKPYNLDFVSNRGYSLWWDNETTPTPPPLPIVIPQFIRGSYPNQATALGKGEEVMKSQNVTYFFSGNAPGGLIQKASDFVIEGTSGMFVTGSDVDGWTPDMCNLVTPAWVKQVSDNGWHGIVFHVALAGADVPSQETIKTMLRNGASSGMKVYASFNGTSPGIGWLDIFSGTGLCDSIVIPFIDFADPTKMKTYTSQEDKENLSLISNSATGLLPIIPSPKDWEQIGQYGNGVRGYICYTSNATRSTISYPTSPKGWFRGAPTPAGSKTDPTDVNMMIAFYGFAEPGAQLSHTGTPKIGMHSCWCPGGAGGTAENTIYPGLDPGTWGPKIFDLYTEKQLEGIYQDGWDSIMWDFELSTDDVVLADFEKLFERAKAAGLINIVTVSHLAPYGFPSPTHQWTEAWSTNPNVTAFSPQLYSAGDIWSDDVASPDDVPAVLAATTEVTCCIPRPLDLVKTNEFLPNNKGYYVWYDFA